MELFTISDVCCWFHWCVVWCAFSNSLLMAVALSILQKSLACVWGSRSGGVTLFLFLIIFVICQNFFDAIFRFSSVLPNVVFLCSKHSLRISRFRLLTSWCICGSRVLCH